MASSLSHGLPALATAGNRIVDASTQRPVLLRGIVRSGLEYCSPDEPGSLAKAGITDEEIGVIVEGWGANVIRIPFNQDWALQRFGYDASTYLAALDFVIEAAARRGAYTLLDLQWLDARTPRGKTSDGRDSFVAPLPNLESIELWSQLAERYRAEPAVLFDIFNEPHDALPDDRVPLLGLREDGTPFLLPARTVTMAEWKPWAAALISAIRSRNSTALVFVPGVQWAYDLRGFPLAGFDNLVYSTHLYSNKEFSWDLYFGKLAGTFPVFAGEVGGTEDDLSWGQALFAYLASKEVGFTAWSWSDYPRLIQTPLAPDYRLTAFGQLVRDTLSKYR